MFVKYFEDLSNKISNKIKDYAKSKQRNEIWDIDIEEDTIIAHIQNDSFKIERTVSYYKLNIFWTWML